MTVKQRIFAGVIIVALLLVMFTGPLLFQWWLLQDRGALQLAEPAPDFHLQSVDGQWRGLADFAGSYVYLAFGYSHCSEMCPQQLHLLKSFAAQVDDPDLRFVWISIDPKESAEQVGSLLGDSPRFTGLLTESEKQAQQLANSYKNRLNFHSEPAQNDYISHSGLVYLINPEGELVRMYALEAVDAGKLRDDLVQLRKQ